MQDLPVLLDYMQLSLLIF